MTLAELKTLIQNYVQNSETTFVNTLDDIIKNTVLLEPAGDIEDNIMNQIYATGKKYSVQSQFSKAFLISSNDLICFFCGIINLFSLPL